MAGAEAGGWATIWVPAQADFDLFAELSGDDNPIHVDPDFSARTRFGRTVSHGMLLYARLWAMICDRHPSARAASQALMFPAPSFADEPLRLTVEPKPDAPDRLMMSIARASDGEMTLIGECRLTSNDAPRPTERVPAPVPDVPRRESPILHLGRSATISRTFRAGDAIQLGALAGLTAPVTDGVPEPLIGGMFSYLLGVRLPGFGTNYLKQEMEFLALAPFDTPLTARVAITRIRPDKDLVDLSTTCALPDGTLVCRGRALVMVKDVERTIAVPG